MDSNLYKSIHVCVLLSLSYMLSILSVLYYNSKLLYIGRWCGSRIALELWMEKKWRSKHSNYLRICGSWFPNFLLYFLIKFVS